jgi:DNA polymerase alpha subunit B
MAEPTDAQLQELFSSPNSNLEPDVLAELTSIMRLHQIDPQELYFKWEAYSMKMGGDEVKLNIDTARDLKQHVQDGLERENRSKAQSLNSTRRAAATPRTVTNTTDVYGMYEPRSYDMTRAELI